MRVLLMVLGVILAILGCVGEEYETADMDIPADEVVLEGDIVVGTWEVVEVTRGEDIGNTGTVYVFNGDGTMSSSSGVLTIEGTYVTVTDTLDMVLGGLEFQALFSFEDSRLIYEIVNGDQVFAMERI